MAEVIGATLRHQCKIQHFDPAGLTLRTGDHIIVKGDLGEEYATVVMPAHELSEDKLPAELKPVLRIATEEDEERITLNRKNEWDAVRITRDRVKKREMEMKIIRADYTFDRSKVTIYFTADGRVDFRELVRDLASIFRTRIELRQVGVRDETKLLGGIGPCGREFCCATWLTDFVPVSIKMAKEQNLSLNSAKISGCCGRLMCCLKNEADTYSYLNAKLPDVNTPVKTPDGTIGKVQSVNVLRQQVRVVIEEQNGNVEIRDFDVSELQFKPSKKKEKRLSQEEEKELKELEG
ncbi:MAG: stage 0 sporulation family protein [Lachnospiraceae bacterium]|nr:stage 0 sporulation family protein [Lachnospiraceae bacterium]MBR5339873.1 stage 0 sporulation family protein [Lachnospiraceae bacterium]